MRTRWALPAILVVAAVGVWLFLGGSHEDRGTGGGTGEEGLASRTPPPVPGLARSPSATGPVPAAIEEDPIPLGRTTPGGFGVIVHVQTEPGSRPVAGETVRLRMDAPEPTSFAAVTAVTDETGDARFEPMAVPSIPRRLATVARLVPELVDAEPESNGIFYRKPAVIGVSELAGVMEEHTGVSVDPSSTEDVRWIRVVLWKPVEIPVEGRVTTETGVGIPGTVVNPGASEFDGVFTDDEGRFLLRIASAARIRLTATLGTWGYRELTRSLQVDVPAEGARGLAIVLPGVGTITGRAVEADGRPAAGVEVCLTEAGKSTRNATLSSMSMSFLPAPAFVLRTHADLDGRFRFVGTLPERTYDVRSWRTQEEDAAGAPGVAYDAKDVEIRLERHGVLVLLLDAADGRVVHGTVRVRIGAEEHGDDSKGWLWPDQPGTLAPAGTKVTILARARGYADETVEHVVSERAGLDPVTIRMRRTDGNPTVRVRCVDVEGKPLPWPAVRWSKEPSGIGVSPRGEVREGAFTTDDLGPATYTLRTDDGFGMASTPEFAGLPMSGPLRFVPHATRRVEVPESGTVDVAWQLPLGGALSIAVRAPDGTLLEPGDMRSVRARNERGEEVEVHLFHPGRNGGWELGTGVAAVYESQALAPGAWDVTWNDRGAVTAKVLVKAGELTPVTFRVPAGK